MAGAGGVANEALLAGFIASSGLFLFLAGDFCSGGEQDVDV